LRHTYNAKFQLHIKRIATDESARGSLILKEIMAMCGSFYNAQTVSMGETRETIVGNLTSICPSSVRDCIFKKIVAGHSLEMVTSNGKTVFRSL